MQLIKNKLFLFSIAWVIICIIVYSLLSPFFTSLQPFLKLLFSYSSSNIKKTNQKLGSVTKNNEPLTFTTIDKIEKDQPYLFKIDSNKYYLSTNSEIYEISDNSIAILNLKDVNVVYINGNKYCVIKDTNLFCNDEIIKIDDYYANFNPRGDLETETKKINYKPSFTSNNHYLVTSSILGGDGSYKVWNLENKELVFEDMTLEFDDAIIIDDRFIFSNLNYDDSISLFDIVEKKFIYKEKSYRDLDRNISNAYFNSAKELLVFFNSRPDFLGVDLTNSLAKGVVDKNNILSNFKSLPTGEILTSKMYDKESDSVIAIARSGDKYSLYRYNLKTNKWTLIKNLN